MALAPATRASLLMRLRQQGDDGAWGEFVDLYAPVVYGFARKQGLQDADAADLTQDVLGSVLEAMGRFEYDRSKGSFRGWLFTLARNRLRDSFDKRNRHVQGSGDTAVHALLEQHRDRDDPERLWDEEYQRHLLLTAAVRIRGDFQPATWDAFWRSTIQGEAVKDVAVALSLSVASVYLARSRVMARLKERIRLWDED